jgi:hypothetical protein
MKNTNAEILKTNTVESMDLKQMVETARMKVSTEQMEAHTAEDDARSLELELREAQVTHEKKEEAERQGKETSEKITELTG